MRGYAGNPNNANGWIKEDVPLLGEKGEPLGAEADKLIGSPVVDEIAEPIAEGEERVIASVIDVEEDIAMLFGADNFSDDDSEGFKDDEEIWEGHSLGLLASGAPVPPLVIEDLCTCMGNLEHGHGLLGKKVIKMSDAEVADSITTGEVGPRVSAVEGQVHVMTSQMVQVMGRLEQVGTQIEQGQQVATQRDETIKGLSQQVQTLQAAVQHRDLHIQQLQTMVSEMSSHESTLMQCILGMDRRLVDLERRPSGS
ncbi:hypothetical protein Tco_0671560 [Tanacetum coccineum]